MNAKERSERLVRMYSPRKVRKKGAMMNGITGRPTEKPNSQRTIVDRSLDSYEKLTSDLHFLVGMLTVLPCLQSKRTVQLQHEGEKVLSEADDLIEEFFREKRTTVNAVRKMRVYGEKIIRLRDKINKEMARA